jgi:hypothetical protein
MARKLGPVKIHVEGRNDLFALINLLIRHGVDYDRKPRPPEFPEFSAAISDSDDPTREAVGVDAVLLAISEEVAIQSGRIVGFVLDADDQPDDRWSSIRARLAVNEVTTLDDPPLPVEQLTAIPEGGFLGISQRFKTRVGVWLMPDNRGPGALEQFLQALVPPKNPLFQFSQKCTKQSLNPKHGATIREVDKLKAELACWLAWQANPGRPYGTAIRAGYFGKDSAQAERFVSWFKTLFGITP